MLWHGVTLSCSPTLVIRDRRSSCHEREYIYNIFYSPREEIEEMPNTLTPQQVSDFHRDGYLFPVPAIGRDAARHYRDRLETHERRTAAGELAA